MKEEDIRRIVQDEMEKQNRFGDPLIYPHSHDGNNSPAILAPTLSYIGFVPYTSIISTPGLEFVLPTGWLVRYFGSGTYEIVHNLWSKNGINFYSLVADACQSTNEKVAPVVSPFLDSFSISWFRCSDGTAVDTSFNFNLTVVNTLVKNQVKYTALNLGV